MYKNEKRYALTNCVLLDGTEHMTPQTAARLSISAAAGSWISGMRARSPRAMSG